MNQTLKVVLVGENAAGKTSLLQAYRNDAFKVGNAPTIGADYKVTNNVEIIGQLFNVAIWDTAGQEKFRSITKQSLRNANVAILCFDLSDPDSYQYLQGWIDFIEVNCSNSIGIVIAGTKLDLPNFYSQTRINDLLESLKTKQKLKLFCSSAKTKEGIQKTFQYALKKGAQHKLKEALNNQKSFKLSVSGCDYNYTYLETQQDKSSNINNTCYCYC